MADLFGVDIAGIIAAQMGPQLLPAVLTVVTPGVRDPDDITGGTKPTEESFTGRGVLEKYSILEKGSSLIRDDSRKCILITKTFPVPIDPKPTDKVNIEGLEYFVYEPIERDPAAATFTCQLAR